MKSEAMTEKVSLVDLNSQYAAVVAELKAAGGEMTDDSEKLYESLLEALCAKTDGYGIVLEKLEHEAAYWKYQKEKCAEAQKAIENHVEALKNRMRFVLSQTEGEALQGDLYRFFLAKAKDRILFTDEAAIPREYFKSELVVSVDRKAVEAAVAKGLQVPGVTVEPSKSLRTGRPK